MAQQSVTEYPGWHLHAESCLNNDPVPTSRVLLFKLLIVNSLHTRIAICSILKIPNTFNALNGGDSSVKKGDEGRHISDLYHIHKNKHF